MDLQEFFLLLLNVVQVLPWPRQKEASAGLSIEQGRKTKTRTTRLPNFGPTRLFHFCLEEVRLSVVLDQSWSCVWGPTSLTICIEETPEFAASKLFLWIQIGMHFVWKFLLMFQSLQHCSSFCCISRHRWFLLLAVFVCQK